jgi:endo-1,4-beta-xylanase
MDEGFIGLNEKYEELFRIGAAVDSGSYTTHRNVVTRHFGSITAENEMKFESLQRTEGSFNYATADAMLDFAEDNRLAVRGHALVWHRQTPAWVFSDGADGLASEEQLLERVRRHIAEVMGHFRGRVYAWDVVNEAIMDDGSYRTGDETRDDQKSQWYAILGERYIAEAFRAAREADPEAKLFYNDYFNYVPARRQGIYEMLRGLLDDGVPIDGVGLQAHLNIAPSEIAEHPGYHQTVENLEAAIEAYASLGLEIHITEMDVSLYVPGTQYPEEDLYTEETFDEELEQRQAERYAEFFEMFRNNADGIENVTLWGVADDNTWLSEFSSGRQDFPLLFDGLQQPKQALDAVMDF